MLLAAFPAWAQGNGGASQETAWYIVRPGDTLEELTARYLGSEKRWEENWQLNSDDIDNPHRIYPGQRIKLLRPPSLPEDGALLKRVSNRVEDQPTPLEWIEALSGELLRARDGVKTYEASSALLEFADDSRMVLTERSTVFLGAAVQTPAEVDRTQIEIVIGQADLEGPAVAKATTQFEIVLGAVRATPRAGKDSALQTRARRPQSGGAQLMVYSGESDLEAAGAKVMVASGMGSSVPEGKPPEAPEKLLPAPVELEPADGTQIATPQPTFSWQPVRGARDYTLEVCRDPRCGSLVERVQALAEATWQAEGLPVEKLYWRVTAISPSGLDGFPSDSMALEILTAVPDTTKPTVQIGFSGPQLAPRAGLNDVWIVGPGMEIEIEVEDAGSGVDRWTARVDGEETSAAGLTRDWEPGKHTVAVAATDRAGNRVETEMPFIYDPEAPALSWGVEGDAGALGVIAGESEEVIAAARRDYRGRHRLRIGNVDWQLDSDLAQVRLRPQTRKPIGLEGLGSLGHEQGLWVLADDAVCSDLATLTYALAAGTNEDEYVLWMKAVDCVGNSVVGQLPLARQKSSRR